MRFVFETSPSHYSVNLFIIANLFMIAHHIIQLEKTTMEMQARLTQAEIKRSCQETLCFLSQM